MTTRLSIISLAGMARTLVAVGTSSEAFMFLTTAAEAPRSTWFSSPARLGLRRRAWRRAWRGGGGFGRRLAWRPPGAGLGWRRGFGCRRGCSRGRCLSWRGFGAGAAGGGLPVLAVLRRVGRLGSVGSGL